MALLAHLAPIRVLTVRELESPESQLPPESMIFEAQPTVCTGVDSKGLEIKEIINEGCFGLVLRSFCKQRQQHYAVKVVLDSDIFQREKKVFDAIKDAPSVCPFIVECFGTTSLLEEDGEACGDIILEECSADLHTFIVSEHFLPSKDLMQFAVAEITLALEYLHSLGVVYNDLKAENILIAKDGHLKLCDFGFSTFVDEDGTCSDVSFGTLQYTSPEVFYRQSVSMKRDYFALGVVLYELVFGLLPWDFEHENEETSAVARRICEEEVVFPCEFRDFSCQTLIRGLLMKDPAPRYGGRQVLAHRFLQGINYTETMQPPSIIASFLEHNK